MRIRVTADEAKKFILEGINKRHGTSFDVCEFANSTPENYHAELSEMQQWTPKPPRRPLDIHTPTTSEINERYLREKEGLADIPDEEPEKL